MVKASYPYVEYGMDKNINFPHQQVHRTLLAYTWTSILNTPFWAMITLLLFILYKDLHATPVQITVFLMLRPLVSIFSVYWSAYVDSRRDRLKPNVIWACVLGNIPFLFFPFIQNAWYIVLSAAFYMMLSRGAMPAWMEILRLTLPQELNKKIVSRGATISYLGGGILALFVGWLMDDHPHIWRWIFTCTAMCNILAVWFQRLIEIPSKKSLENAPLEETAPPLGPTFSQTVLQPWISAWRLVRARPDFARFLWGFMLGGFGLIVVQPALPVFFVDVLQLSYKELSAAFIFCKGIAFAATSPLWVKWLHRVSIFRFCSAVTLLASLFPLLLIAAQFHIICVYLAYLSYGVMQAGSELSWHLSGPLFSKGEDSSTYSSVNIAMIGLRACVTPAIGALLLAASSPTVILLLGCSFSLLASWRMAVYGRNYAETQVAAAG